MPIAVYPALALTGAKVSDVVTNPQVQVETQMALHERFLSPLVLSAMDLSAEAEAFGCAVQFSENEIPSITGRLITDVNAAQKLPIPKPGDKRTSVYLESVRCLKRLAGHSMVIGGCIGPFSLAARLVGVSEAMEMTVTEPELMQVLLEKSTAFLSGYVRAFGQAGADGVIMAEPAAGLLSPRALAQFSSGYLKLINAAIVDDGFAIILHNCAAKLLHLPAILESGLDAFHFGAPMDIVAALGKVPANVVLCGNLDPTGVFLQLPPAEIADRVTALLRLTDRRPNFVLSSGCDLPPTTPLASLEAFYSSLQNAE